MNTEIPEIYCNFHTNKCKEHTDIYIQHYLPCPYPNCKSGLLSSEFIDKGSPMNLNGKIIYQNENIYIRESWKGLDGEVKYIWIKKKRFTPYCIRNIIYNEIFKIVNNKSSDLIYHYTNREALSKILESNEIWLTDWKDTNDKEEIKHGLKIAEKFNNDKLNIKSKVKKNNYFIASFSYEINNITLFDRYADNAKGVAIEFYTEFNIKNNFWYKNIEFTNLMPIIYNEEIQKKIMQHMFYILENVKKWIYQSDEYINRKNKLISKKKRINFLEKDFIRITEEVISFFKHPSFKDERETRWFFKYDTKHIKKYKFSIKSKTFNSKNYYTSTDVHNMSLSEIYKFDNNKEKIKLPIKNIILGSRVKNKKQVIKEIKELCIKFGFEDVGVKVSDIPYK